MNEMGNLTKVELTKQIAEAAKTTAVEAERVLEIALQQIRKALRAGDSVELRGFGKWSVRVNAARVGHNPKTGEKVNVPAKKMVKFKASKDLQKLVN